MRKTVIFDLDNTLYDEIQFVKSGFNEVSGWMSDKFGVDKEKIYGFLMDVLDTDGRGRVFDTVLQKIGLKETGLAGKMVEVYRSHYPDISLYPETKEVLLTLKCSGYKLGIITDGDAGVQRKKVEALGIGCLFDTIIFSDEYGTQNRKPSFHPYMKALEGLGSLPEESVYVGDNPNKDFVSARKIGMGTIRIMKGEYRSVDAKTEDDADHKVRDLNGALKILMDPKGE
ncbi:MAG: HAD-IA family hydrolase [Candidatus Omnitrophota bacterium]|nr:HAD-IA family hydrolase [Candidatus Omnitrophota bacterium]